LVTCSFYPLLLFFICSVTVERDLGGAQLEPAFRHGVLTVLSLGTIVHDRPAFHTQWHLFPVGFTARRMYVLISGSNGESIYTESGRAQFCSYRCLVPQILEHSRPARAHPVTTPSHPIHQLASLSIYLSIYLSLSQPTKEGGGGGRKGGREHNHIKNIFFFKAVTLL
jgi:hypothetical protein